MIIKPDNKHLQYSGRIDFKDSQAPVLVYPCTAVAMRFTGTFLKVILENHRSCWNNYMGYIIDGKQEKILLPESGKATLTLAEGLENRKHELMFFKRMDSCHTVTFYGFEVEDTAVISSVPEKPHRRIEVYGDSVSAGEVSEAVEYVGQADPEHNGEYSNSWYSYSWMTARKLNAQIHNIAQGGISLLDDTGWFAAPHYKGMETCYNKIQYHPDLGPVKRWDFSLYRPHVVIVAIGQNDNHPLDYMAEDYEGEKAVYWRSHYKAFIEHLREIYPKAEIIVTTTILEHSDQWDRAIEEVYQELKEGDGHLHHFLYSNNGCGTKGHIRIPEADKMSDELAAFIESLGEDIWRDEAEHIKGGMYMPYTINYENSVANPGNLYRMKRLMERAKAGEKLTLGFLGGSITQGSLASSPQTCYAYRVFSWWQKQFPKAEFTYINAGIGGTTSQFGAARVESDLLVHKPDFVIVEFSVNDDSTEHFCETYEGLVRKIYASDTKPAMLLVHNVYYSNGSNAQLQHAKAARHYQLPAVSMQSTIYPEVVSGKIPNREITPDDLHPNDAGHELVAGVITDFLEKTEKKLTEITDEPYPMPEPFTANHYENSVRWQNYNCTPVTDSFMPDMEKQNHITECFRNGWTASKEGAKITFEVEGTCIGVQYRKSIRKPTPVAELVIDGNRKHAVRLDGNFDEDWGDCLYLETVAEHIPFGRHTVEITVTETHPEDAVPFYLVSVISSGR